MSKPTATDDLEHAKRWLERAIFHLSKGQEEDAKSCIRFAVQDEDKALKRLQKET